MIGSYVIRCLLLTLQCLYSVKIEMASVIRFIALYIGFLELWYKNRIECLYKWIQSDQTKRSYMIFLSLSHTQLPACQVPTQRLQDHPQLCQQIPETPLWILHHLYLEKKTLASCATFTRSLSSC